MKSNYMDDVETLALLLQTVVTLEHQTPGTTALVLDFIASNGRTKADVPVKETAEERFWSSKR